MGQWEQSGGNLKPGLLLRFHFNFVQIPKNNGKPLKAFKWEQGIMRTVEKILAVAESINNTRVCMLEDNNRDVELRHNR